MEKRDVLVMEILKVEGLTKSFGGVVAIKNVSFSIDDGEHMAIIGPNGAGKTTLFNLLTGFYKPTSGTIYYSGQSIGDKSDYKRTHLGISRSFQITSLFNQLSVMENIILALQGTRKYRYQMVQNIRNNKELMAGVEQWLKFMDLWELRHEPVHCISYGQQRKLEIALSMVSEPRLLLLDEPSCGLTTAESDELSKMISNLEKRITVICVAHDMDLVFSIASRILVLHYGEIITEGSPNQIKESSKVKEIYMGSEENE